MEPVRKREKMHYANGREAKNGDKVICINQTSPTVGILYEAVAGNDFCNGRLAPVLNSNPCANLKECLHLDDAIALLKKPSETPTT
jgi:hypothetical protein